MADKEKMKKVFSDCISDETLTIDGASVVDFDTFYDFFKDVHDVKNYDNYVKLDDGKGYIPFFNKCKEKGILN